MSISPLMCFRHILLMKVTNNEGGTTVTLTYIKFDSQTYGEKAKQLLSRNRIKSHLRRNPNPNRKEGCNFALFVDGNIWTAYDIINEHHIKNLGVESFRERL